MRVLSLFDHSGAWSRPYLTQGAEAIRVDTGHPPGGAVADDGALLWGGDVRSFLAGYSGSVCGILAAPPCRCMTRLSARLWPKYDASGETWESLSLVDAVLDAVAYLRPAWWVLENPPGRLWRTPAVERRRGPGLRQDALGAPRLKFLPWQFAGWLDEVGEEDRTKLTYLWGDFEIPERRPVQQRPKPAHLAAHQQGDWTSRQPSGRGRAKTPEGFALAFAAANPAVEMVQQLRLIGCGS